MSSENHAIDAVIAWVDSNDSQHLEKLNTYLPLGKKKNEGTLATRFRAVNELEYCLRSLLKFAPFLSNIYIVTDDQTPNCIAVLQKEISEASKIKIIDHKEIFRDYETLLPIFNSRSIASAVWRIKGLAEHFVYLNDDFFVLRELNPEDWFINGKPVVRGKWKTSPWIEEGIKSLKEKISQTSSKINPTFKTLKWHGAKKAGFKYKYLDIYHTPHPMRKSTIQNYFENAPEEFFENIKFRFRDFSQFSMVSFANHLEISKGNAVVRPPQEVYMKPVNRSKNYIPKKIAIATNDASRLFLCIQSLDSASKSDQTTLINWLKNYLA